MPVNESEEVVLDPLREVLVRQPNEALGTRLRPVWEDME